MECNKFWGAVSRGMAERTFPGPVEDALRGFSGDRLSGASSMLEVAAGAFSALSAHSAAKDGAAFIAELEDLSAALVDAQPMMAPIYNLCASVLHESQPSCKSLPKLKKVAFQTADQFVKDAVENLEKACQAASQLVLDGSRILTLSFSRAVLRSLELARKDWKKFPVTLLEARPMFEGREMARRLSELGIQVELATDAAVASEVRRAAMVLIGADALTQEVLINKSGTLAVAMIAKEASVPMFAVADGSKLLPDAFLPETDRPRNPNEVWESAPQGVKVRNLYFERVPLKYIKTVAMDDGPCKKEDIAKKLEKAAPGMETLAGLLGNR
jgi:translation initiation factor 2B subunit (eIF-2B alpha/beta/delta family)